MNFKIQIYVDDEAKTVEITDSRNPEEVKTFKGGINIIAADGNEKKYYVLSFGAAADLGWAMAQFFNDGWKNPFVKRLFGHLTQWINEFFVHDGMRYDQDDLEEVLDKWEKEESNKKEPTFN